MSAGTASPFPWEPVLAHAFRVLRWPPDAVWGATPREIAWAVAPPGGVARPLRGTELAGLMRRFPDTEG